MHRDSPELPAPSRLLPTERAKQQPTKPTHSCSATLSPVHVSTAPFTRAAAWGASNDVGTLTPPVMKHGEWVATRRMQTAPDSDLYRPLLMAPFRSVSARELIGSLPSSMQQLPASVRQTHSPAPGNAATELSFFSSSSSISTSSSGGSRRDRSCSSTRSTTSSIEGRDVQSKPPGRNHLARGAPDFHKARQTASSSGDHHRSAVPLSLMASAQASTDSWTRSTAATTAAAAGAAPRPSLTLPPLPSSALPKAPTTLTMLSARGGASLSPRRSPEFTGSSAASAAPGGGGLPPRSVSPLGAHSSARVPHRPHRCSGSDDFDDSAPTPPLEAIGLSEDAVGGAAVRGRRGKRVGRGFTRRNSEAESAEERHHHPVVTEPCRPTCTASDIAGSTSSTGLLGMPTATTVNPTAGASAIERSRRSSISFNNEVAVANEDAETDGGGLHQLCDTPHHQSVAQPPPQSLLETSYSTLSSTTLLRRDGVTYII